MLLDTASQSSAVSPDTATPASGSRWHLSRSDETGTCEYYEPPAVVHRLLNDMVAVNPPDVLEWMHIAIWHLHAEELGRCPAVMDVITNSKDQIIELDESVTSPVPSPVPSALKRSQVARQRIKDANTNMAPVKEDDEGTADLNQAEAKPLRAQSNESINDEPSRLSLPPRSSESKNDELVRFSLPLRPLEPKSDESLNLSLQPDAMMVHQMPARMSPRVQRSITRESSESIAKQVPGTPLADDGASWSETNSQETIQSNQCSQRASAHMTNMISAASSRSRPISRRFGQSCADVCESVPVGLRDHWAKSGRMDGTVSSGSRSCNKRDRQDKVNLRLHHRWKELHALSADQHEEEEGVIQCPWHPSSLVTKKRPSTSGTPASALSSLGKFRPSAHCRPSAVSVMTCEVQRIQSPSPLSSYNFSMLVDTFASLEIGVFRPHSRGILVWKILGPVFMLYDALTIPLHLAFSSTLRRQSLDLFVVLCSVLYRTLDLPITLNTGFYKRGALVMDRPKIWKAYFRAWALMDLCIVCLDYVLIIGSGSDERILSIAAFLRVLWWVLKMNPVSQLFEEALGTENLIFVIPFVKTCIAILLCAHQLACGWYTIGRMGKDAGRPNWLERGVDDQEDSKYVLYLESLHFVMVQLGIGDSWTNPVSAAEKGYTLLVMMLAFGVIGTSLSIITSTVQEINQLTSETTRRRLMVRQYLISHNTPSELFIRMMHYVDFMLKHSATTLDESLLSPALLTEFNVNLRGKYMISPWMDLVRQGLPSIFSKVCCAMKLEMHGKDEVIFKIGDLEQCLYITAKGSFFMENADSSELYFDLPRCLAEICLYVVSVRHSSTLKAETYAETLTIDGETLATTLRHSPVCCTMIFEYAEALISQLQDGLILSDYLNPELLDKSCSMTTLNNIVRPNEQLLLSNFNFSGHETSNTSDTLSRLVRKITARGDESKSLMLGGRVSMGSEAIDCRVEESFPELDIDSGVYAYYSSLDERNRAVASVHSIIWLLRNDYEEFTAAQPLDKRMTLELWNKLQVFVESAKPDGEMVQAVLVFLTIRGVGKIKSLRDQLPVNFRAPEQAVIFLMNNMDQVLPSLTSLSETSFRLIESMFALHEEFNLAQLLQGENTPANVKRLKEYLSRFTEGDRIAKIYMLSFFGVMSGILGHKGGSALTSSLFMDQTNGTNLLDAMRLLERVESASPHAIYWNYIRARCRSICPSEDSSRSDPQTLVLMRLACLNRVQTVDEFQQLQGAWRALPVVEHQQVLIDHFLADGIMERSFLLSFLPQCFVNAKQNLDVGLQLMLVMLAELIRHLRIIMEEIDKAPTQITVDCSDFATYVKDIHNLKNPEMARGVIQQCDIVQQTRDRWKIVMRDTHRMSISMGRRRSELDQRRFKDDGLENMLSSIVHHIRNGMTAQQKMTLPPLMPMDTPMQASTISEASERSTIRTARSVE